MERFLHVEKYSPLIIVEKLSKKTHPEQTLVAQILFTITFPVIVNSHPVTNLVIVYKVPTSVKNFVNVVQTALIGSQDVGVKHSVTPNSVHAFWLSENVIQTCVQSVVQINMMLLRSLVEMCLFSVGLESDY